MLALRRIFFAVASLGCFLPGSAWAQSELSFTRQDISLGTSVGNRQSATGDFNADSHADLVVATAVTGLSAPTMRILLGNGDGSFQSAPTLDIAQEAGPILVSDLNNDGNQDLAAPSFFETLVAVWLGNGDGTFQRAPDLVTGHESISAAAGDFDDDGVQDLAVSLFMNGASDLRIYLGNGDGTFAQGQEIVDGNPRFITIGDFDGDGREDLAVVDFFIADNVAQNSLLILLGQGDGSFEPVAQEAVIPPETRAITSGDFDSDGRLDVATTAVIASVLMGNGDGTFDPAQHLSQGVPPPPISSTPSFPKVADFNGDGHEDLVIGNEILSDPPVESSVSILLSRGDGTFEPFQQFATGRTMASLVVADWNSDGNPDLATSNHETSTLTILIAAPSNPQCRVPSSNPPATASSSNTSGGVSPASDSGGGGALGSELWLLSAIVIARYLRRRALPTDCAS